MSLKAEMRRQVVAYQLMRPQAEDAKIVSYSRYVMVK